MQKKSQFTRADRGPTFVGFTPKVGKSKQDKLKSEYNKHKHKREEYTYA